MVADEATFQIRTDRHDYLPWGVNGGKPGTPTRNYINPDSVGVEIPGKHLMALKKGDLYRLVQAGGGGYGDPLERDIYSVLVTSEPDLKATEELRSTMQQEVS